MIFIILDSPTRDRQQASITAAYERQKLEEEAAHSQDAQQSFGMENRKSIDDHSKQTPQAFLLVFFCLIMIYEAIEDSRTALQRVHKFLVDLDLLTHSRTRQSPNIACTSTSSTELVTAELLENDGRRVEIMNRIIEILERNLRVRYELKISDVLKS